MSLHVYNEHLTATGLVHEWPCWFVIHTDETVLHPLLEFAEVANCIFYSRGPRISDGMHQNHGVLSSGCDHPWKL